MSEAVLREIGHRVATLTLNRPQVHNALSDAVISALVSELGELAAREDVGAVVITGAGERAFAAGADIGELRGYDLRAGLTASMARACDLVEQFPKPTIAAVNGYALGGGCELAMACDIRIASSTATFGLPETALGVLPGAGGTQRLTRLVSGGRAIEMILTGRTVSAADALTMGLVTEVVEPGALGRRARETARAILARGPVAVRLAKLVVRAAADCDQRTGQLIEQLAQTVLYGTDDKRIGAEAFLAKRPPAFTGR
jgi:enoyl-CoA hydratase/carnithine racemase